MGSWNISLRERTQRQSEPLGWHQYRITPFLFVSDQTSFYVCRLVKSAAHELVKSLPYRMEMTMASQIQFTVVSSNLVEDI